MALLGDYFVLIVAIGLTKRPIGFIVKHIPKNVSRNQEISRLKTQLHTQCETKTKNKKKEHFSIVKTKTTWLLYRIFSCIGFVYNVNYRFARAVAKTLHNRKCIYMYVLLLFAFLSDSVVFWKWWYKKLFCSIQWKRNNSTNCGDRRKNSSEKQEWRTASGRDIDCRYYREKSSRRLLYEEKET